MVGLNIVADDFYQVFALPYNKFLTSSNCTITFKDLSLIRDIDIKVLSGFEFLRKPKGPTSYRLGLLREIQKPMDPIGSCLVTFSISFSRLKDEVYTACRTTWSIFSTSTWSMEIWSVCFFNPVRINRLFHLLPNPTSILFLRGGSYVSVGKRVNLNKYRPLSTYFNQGSVK